jgi:Zincin-like metallopeptidase
VPTRPRSPRPTFASSRSSTRSQVDPLPDFPGGPIDLDPPIEPIAGDGLAHLFDPLAEFGEHIGSPVAIEAVPGAASGYYEPATRRIVIDVIGEDFSANAQVATLIHELAHALVRCDRSEEEPKLSYAEEEVVVESAAYTVCGAVGLDTSGFSVPYLTGWSERAGGAEAIERGALAEELAQATGLDRRLRGPV